MKLLGLQTWPWIFRRQRSWRLCRRWDALRRPLLLRLPGQWPPCTASYKRYKQNVLLIRGTAICCMLYRVAPKTGTVDFSGLCSDQQLCFFTLLDRASFLHYNNTKIIKFGWELFILRVIFYGLSFSGFARFAVRKLRAYCVQCMIRVLPNKDLQSRDVISTEISM